MPTTKVDFIQENNHQFLGSSGLLEIVFLTLWLFQIMYKLCMSSKNGHKNSFSLILICRFYRWLKILKMESGYFLSCRLHWSWLFSCCLDFSKFIRRFWPKIQNFDHFDIYFIFPVLVSNITSTYMASSWLHVCSTCAPTFLMNRNLLRHH